MRKEKNICSKKASSEKCGALGTAEPFRPRTRRNFPGTHGGRVTAMAAAFATAFAVLVSGSLPGAAPAARAADTATLQNPRISEVQGGELDAASGLRNPRVKMRIRDTVTFGSYWQEDTNGDGIADQTDAKQPITWQVLSVDGDDVFLLADKVLDCQPYNTEYESVTWETCSLRSWLNSDFYNAAFSEAEKAAIRETAVTNADNPEQGTEGGADTKDKVYLLSFSEAVSPVYGFHGTYSYDDQSRTGKATAYAEGQGVWTNKEGGSDWWLRSPGYHDNDAVYVESVGYAYPYGTSVDHSDDGVRPALHLNLSSFSPNVTPVVETALEESEWDLVELGTWEDRPLRWRILSVEDGDAFLLADQIIVKKRYHEEAENVTWEKSTLRSWLNGEFYQGAFSESEKSGIRSVTWDNPDNPWYGTEGGSDTVDPVALLSLPDVVKKEYGFPTGYGCDSRARQAVAEEWGSDWWLRSPGLFDNNAAYVYSGGFASPTGNIVTHSDDGVRPALHLNLSSFSPTKAGTVNVKEDSAAGGSSGDPSGDGSATPEPSPTPSGGGASPSPVPTPSGGTQNQTGGSGNSTVNGGTPGGTQTVGDQDGKTGQEAGKKPGKVTSVKAKNSKKKTATLTWKKLSGAKKYQVQYSQSKKFKKAKTKTVKKAGCKIAKLAKKKTYYFRVRGISADGRKGTWSKTAKVKIKK